MELCRPVSSSSGSLPFVVTSCSEVYELERSGHRQWRICSEVSGSG